MTCGSPDELLRAIEAREARVGVIGLGYVGLPLCLTMVERGLPVVGFDLDRAKIDTLRQGRSHIAHIDAERIPKALATRRFEVTTDFDQLSSADVILICVPTPLTEQREPDMTYIVATGEEIAKRLRPCQLVVLESTTYPGTTDELLRSILEKTGLRFGSDFFLAFSPEREDPGNAQFTTATIPKVVGGVDETSLRLAKTLYDLVMTKTVPVSSARAAEATKLTENVFRAVNIALVNELKVVYDRMGIDVWEVLDAASTKPFGFMRFDPGPGWGGHCVPLDPFYLTWKAREYGVAPRFIELAGEINTELPDFVMNKLFLAFNDRSKAIRGSKVLLLGLAYKRDVDDHRESPAWIYLRRLLGLGATVSYHDPHIPRTTPLRHWPDIPILESQKLAPELLQAQDAVMIMTAHSAVDYKLVAEHARLIIDTRGVYRGKHSNVVPA